MPLKILNRTGILQQHEPTRNSNKSLLLLIMRNTRLFEKSPEKIIKILSCNNTKLAHRHRCRRNVKRLNNKT